MCVLTYTPATRGELANVLLGGLLRPLYGVALATGRISLSDVAIFTPFTLLCSSSCSRPSGPTAAPTGQPACGAWLSVFPPAWCAPAAAAAMAALPPSIVAAWRLTRRESPGPALLAMTVMLLARLLAWVAVLVR